MNKDFRKQSVLYVMTSAACVVMIMLSSCASSADRGTRGAILINDNQTGDGIHQIEYSSGWTYAADDENKFNGDDHYNGTAGSWYQIRFEGSKVRIYGTVDAHHGSATVNINGDQVQDEISFFGERRAYQRLVYESPDLEHGDHRIRVTTTGDGVITLDFVEVLISDNKTPH